jgi:hypothetical protein
MPEVKLDVIKKLEINAGKATVFANQTSAQRMQYLLLVSSTLTLAEVSQRKVSFWTATDASEVKNTLR